MTALHRMGRPAPITPRYSIRPMRMHPSRRTQIYGKLKPMDQPRDRTAPYFIGLAVLVASYFIWRSVV